MKCCNLSILKNCKTIKGQVGTLAYGGSDNADQKFMIDFKSIAYMHSFNLIRVEFKYFRL